MAIKKQCDMCKEHFDPDKVVEYRLAQSGIGHYHTVDLCKDKCHKEIQRVIENGTAG